ncbi:MAG: cytochrome c maturation protein CcmE [Rhodospirillaceae bacterium]|jgi:cytochrome c-type biogenesis protein CcmE|nr:cytochrome c maturation protein CcmE [Rhodospirillaceae bacterium]MBT4486160.1 cytochrome c maturation protein CcmE [Rhodospirillaceae bacterium]MBT5898284.1 cytochrome c maturation protein CcmE [Rhodospirillaceae bacterium]MBT6430373.1 cytochrome c maturation protein CcmE [Rhodospirillaceae bacterium]MBT7760871.1 cytochrome c maturation protein CcmE [Rhodospirillaceae bacterium]
MTRKRRRLYIVSGFMLIFATAAALVLMAFEENIVFFYSPTELARKMEQQPIPPNRRLRIGGLVEEGSLGREKDGVTITFRVTDTVEVINVRFRGFLPDLFREGQGIVAEGSVAADGKFVATEVLAKHDETYMPKEVAEALKEAGQWQGDHE